MNNNEESGYKVVKLFYGVPYLPATPYLLSSFITIVVSVESD